MIALNVSPTAGNLGVFVCICVGGWVSVCGGGCCWCCCCCYFGLL